MAGVESKEARRLPGAPFTTSTLQQESSGKLGYSAKQTMMLAQQLYEAGYISYMRTDSVNLSPKIPCRPLSRSLIPISAKIIRSPNRADSKTNRGARSSRSRPADGSHQNARLNERSSLDPKQYKIYDLIWRRFIACQMQPAVLIPPPPTFPPKFSSSEPTARRLNLTGG